MCERQRRKESPGNGEREGVRRSPRPPKRWRQGERAGLETEVFSDLSLGAHREEMAVFKGQEDSVSFSNYISPVFTDLCAEEEKMLAHTQGQVPGFLWLWLSIADT